MKTGRMIIFTIVTVLLGIPFISRVTQNRIDDRGKVVSFQALPPQMKEAYVDYYQTRKNHYNELLTTKQGLEVSLKTHTRSSNMEGYILNGFVYKITISGRDFFLKSNKGMPMVTNGEILVHPVEFWIYNVDSSEFAVYELD